MIAWLLKLCHSECMRGDVQGFENTFLSNKLNMIGVMMMMCVCVCGVQ
jgi:hypothetical protein